MAVHYSNGFRDNKGQMHVIRPERDGLAEASCFLCGGIPGYPMVFWKGGGGQDVYLHEDCAQKFVLSLSRDVWELQRERGDGHIGSNGELRSSNDQ